MARGDQLSGPNCFTVDEAAPGARLHRAHHPLLPPLHRQGRPARPLPARGRLPRQAPGPLHSANLYRVIRYFYLKGLFQFVPSEVAKCLLEQAV